MKKNTLTANNPGFQSTRDELKRSIDQLEKIKYALDESSLVAITDKNGTITYVNKKFCDVSEYTPTELIGQNHRILKSGFHPPEFYEHLWKTISGGHTWHGEIKNVSKHGKYYWVKTTIVPFLDDEGKLEQYVAIRTEITDRKNAEEQLRRSTDQLEKIKYALDESSLVAITDKNGTITYVNKKFCDVSEYTPTELIGQNHRILKSGFHPPEFYEHLWQTVSSGHTWYGEIKNVSKHGKYYWVKTTIVPFLDDDGKPEQYVAIRTEITDRKNAEENLIEANTKIIDNEKQIKKQLEEIELHDRIQTEFINVAAHELRTPIQPLLSYTDLAVKGLIDKTEALEIIKIESTKLQKLANNILDVSRIESGTLSITLEKIRINDIISNIINIMKIELTNGVSLDSEINESENLIIDADGERITQVLTNLVFNSIKFTKDGSIKITTRVIKPDKMEIRITDTGPGIPHEIIPRLFSKFVTKAIGDEPHQGAGLGLFISKGIVLKHKGNISAFNNPEKGATFLVTLPMTHAM